MSNKSLGEAVLKQEQLLLRQTHHEDSKRNKLYLRGCQLDGILKWFQLECQKSCTANTVFLCILLQSGSVFPLVTLNFFVDDPQEGVKLSW
jgi:hypothetical protein